MNKASGGDAITAGVFKILKDDDVKVLHSICQQFEKLSSGHRTGKGSFHSNPKIPKKGNQNNVQSTAQLHSSHTLAK